MISARATTARFFMAVGMLLAHGIATAAYYSYTGHNGGDAVWYYYDWYHWASHPFSLGTVAALQFTQLLKGTFGASYIDCYIFFQSIGFFGIILLMRSFQEIHDKLGAEWTPLSSYILFLPSMYFWTSGIGKDSLLFFAISLSVWSMIAFKRRIAFLAFSLTIMILFRAHIALAVVTSVAIAAFFHRGISTGKKIGLLALSLVAAASLVGSVRATINVDVTDPNSISMFLERRGAIPVSATGATAVRDAPAVVRLVSLLFRPFFFDANGIFGFITSVENIGSILLFIYMIKNWKMLKNLSSEVFFIKFCVFLSVILIAMLTLIYYNVGLGVRERVMVFPPLFCVFVAQWAMTSRSPSPVGVATSSSERIAISPSVRELSQ